MNAKNWDPKIIGKREETFLLIILVDEREN